MPIQIPGQTQSLRPVSGAIPVLPAGGKGAGQIAAGLQQAGNAALGVDQAQFQEQQAEVAAQKRRQAENLQAQNELDRKKTATEIYQAESALSDMARSYTTTLQNTRRGSDAYGVTTDATDWWDNTIEQIGNTIEDNDTRDLFKQRSASLRESHLNSISSYEANQTNQALAESSAAKVSSSVSFAAANAGNPGAVAQSRKDVVEATDVQGKMFGWSKERRQFELEKNLTNLHAQVFQNLAASSPEAAKQYFEDFKSEIDGTQYDSFEKTLATSEYRIGGQRIVDELMGKNMTFDERRAAVKKQAEGEKRDYAMNLLDGEERDQAAKVKAEDEANRSYAYKLFGPTQKISAIDPVTWAKLPGEVQQALRDKERIAKEGQKATTDLGTFDKLNLLAGLDPDKFLRVDLMTVKLSDEDFKHFSNMRNQIINGSSKSVSTLVQAIGAATTGMHEPEKDAFSRAVFDRINKDQGAAKRELNSGEVKTIIQEMRSSIAWNNGGLMSYIGFGNETTSVPALLADPKLFDKFLATIPATEKAQMLNSFPNADPETVLRVYMKAHPEAVR